LLVRENFVARVVSLLELLDGARSPHFHLAFRFFFSLRPSVIQSSNLFRILGERGVRSVEDLELVLLTVDALSAVSACMLLVRTAVTQKIWHRACFSAIAQITNCFGSRPDVRDAVSLLTRRLFMFLALADARGRYRMRSLLIGESLCALRHELPAVWAQQALGAASCTVALRRVPRFFRAFFPMNHALVDVVVLGELDLFAAAAVELKAFPFDAAAPRPVLIPAVMKSVVQRPPIKRSSCRRGPVVPATSPANAGKKKRWKSPKKGKHAKVIIVRRSLETELGPIAAPPGERKRSPRHRRPSPR
jgi:hypothetical protein